MNTNTLIPWMYIGFEAVAPTTSQQEFKTLFINFKKGDVSTSMQNTFKELHKMGKIECREITESDKKIEGDKRRPEEVALENLFKDIEETPFNLIVFPKFDKKLAEITAEKLKKRWGPEYQTDGVALFPITEAEYDSLAIKDNANPINSPYVGIIPIPDDVKQEVGIASFASLIHREIESNLTITLKSVVVDGIKTEKKIDKEKRDRMAKDGFFTWVRTPSGEIVLENAITTRTKTADGESDTTYRFLNKLLIMSYLRFDLRTFLLGKYSRYNLAEDGSIFDSSLKIVTPSMLKIDLIDKLREWERRGFIESAKEAIKKFYIKRSDTNKNDIIVIIDPSLIEQLRNMFVTIRV